MCGKCRVSPRDAAAADDDNLEDVPNRNPVFCLLLGSLLPTHHSQTRRIESTFLCDQCSPNRAIQRATAHRCVPFQRVSVFLSLHFLLVYFGICLLHAARVVQMQGTMHGLFRVSESNKLTVLWLCDV